MTGEVDRTTDFERGLPFHEAWRGDGWEPDPLIADEQALVVYVRDRGLVAVTGWGDAGRPGPLHGLEAQHRLAAALPEAFVPNAVGTSYRLS